MADSGTVKQVRFDPDRGETRVTGWRVTEGFEQEADAVLHTGETLAFLRSLPDGVATLSISSPPYNIGKEYEARVELSKYLESQKPILSEIARVTSQRGSVCWQVGNYVQDGEVFPLDIYYYPIFKDLGLKLRNRVVWHFGHGLHASRRFSGRYETLLWFTKGKEYKFNLDSVRVPSKYPGKRNYNGPHKGELSGNPLGKNPSDFWEALADEWDDATWDIPNVKFNHPEKTIHPCQFPVELVERCVLAMTDPGDWVLDPFAGVGSSAVAALKRGRKAICVDKEARYVQAARARLKDLELGRLATRKIGTPVHQPTGKERIAQRPSEWG